MTCTRKFSTTLVAGTLGIALAFGGASAAHAAPVAAAAPAQAAPTASQEATPSEAQLAEMEEALAVIDRIPDSVLEAGDAATQQWLAENAPAPTAGSGGEMSVQANVLGCAAAIATVIASTAFPAAKILKAKALIKELGGVTEAAKILWGASFSYEKVQALGGAAAALAGELIGITQIKEQCFS